MSSIGAVSHAWLLTVGSDARLAEVAALISGVHPCLAVVCELSGAVVGVITDAVLLPQLGPGHPGNFEEAQLRDDVMGTGSR